MLRIHNREEHEEILKALDKMATTSLYSRLAYLITYGDSGNNDKSDCIVHLYPNAKKMEYGVVWEQFNKLSQDYEFWIGGGLIYFKNTNDWSIHT